MDRVGSVGGNYLSLGIYPQSQPADEELYQTMFYQHGSNFHRKEISTPCENCEFQHKVFSIQGRIASDSSSNRSDIFISLTQARNKGNEFVPKMGNKLEIPPKNYFFYRFLQVKMLMQFKTNKCVPLSSYSNSFVGRDQ